jgi:hypothetical protein
MTTKQKELFDLASPLIEWINKNYHPHVKIIIDCNRAELVEGVMQINNLYDEEGHRKIRVNEDSK